MKPRISILNKRAYYAGAVLIALGAVIAVLGFKNFNSLSYEAYRSINVYQVFGGLTCFFLGLFFFNSSRSLSVIPETDRDQK